MKNKFALELADVKKIAAAAEAEALKKPLASDHLHRGRWRPSAVVAALDGAAPISSHIAPAKARSAALGRKDTKAFEDMINNGRTAFLSAPFVDGLLEGGVAILKDGQCLGAGVGVFRREGQRSARRWRKPGLRRWCLETGRFCGHRKRPVRSLFLLGASWKKGLATQCPMNALLAGLKRCWRANRQSPR